MHRLSAIGAALLALVITLPAAAQAPLPGAALYAQFCASCHGVDLQGGLGPRLVGSTLARADRARIIHDGVAGGAMPAFGGALTDDQIGQLVDFLDRVAADPAAAGVAVVDTLDALDYVLNVEVFAEGLDMPWAIAFPDARTALITERTGALRMVRDGRLLPAPISGTPAVASQGQGGLLDVSLDPAYAQNGWIYLAYSHALAAASDERPTAMTRIVRGRLNGQAWVDEQVVYEAPHDLYRASRHHYGTRIVFDAAGHLYFSIGDRGHQDDAQDLGRPNGKVHRLHRDGTVPADNPFVETPGALPSIFSYGHRNPQGLTIHPETGELWGVEHGPRGGDELNRILAGRNYGWPVITYGINYNGTIITEEEERPGMEQPIAYWRPSIAVGGVEVYTGDLFPRWKGRLLVSALAFQEVRLLDVHDNRVLHQEVLLKDAGRVREVVVGPEGALYVVANEPHRVLRITPREARRQ